MLSLGGGRLESGMLGTIKVLYFIFWRLYWWSNAKFTPKRFYKICTWTRYGAQMCMPLPWPGHILQLPIKVIKAVLSLSSFDLQIQSVYYRPGLMLYLGEGRLESGMFGTIKVLYLHFGGFTAWLNAEFTPKGFIRFAPGQGMELNCACHNPDQAIFFCLLLKVIKAALSLSVHIYPFVLNHIYVIIKIFVFLLTCKFK